MRAALLTPFERKVNTGIVSWLQKTRGSWLMEQAIQSATGLANHVSLKLFVFYLQQQQQCRLLICKSLWSLTTTMAIKAFSSTWTEIASSISNRPQAPAPLHPFQ